MFYLLTSSALAPSPAKARAVAVMVRYNVGLMLVPTYIQSYNLVNSNKIKIIKTDTRFKMFINFKRHILISSIMFNIFNTWIWVGLE